MTRTRFVGSTRMATLGLPSTCAAAASTTAPCCCTACTSSTAAGLKKSAGVGVGLLNSGCAKQLHALRFACVSHVYGDYAPFVQLSEHTIMSKCARLQDTR